MSPIPGSAPVKSAEHSHQRGADIPTRRPVAVPTTGRLPQKMSVQLPPGIAAIPLPPIPLPIPAPKRSVSQPNSPSPKDPERTRSKNHSCPFAKFVVLPFAHSHPNFPHTHPAHHSHTPFPKSAKPSVFIHETPRLPPDSWTRPAARTETRPSQHQPLRKPAPPSLRQPDTRLHLPLPRPLPPERP